MQPKTPAPRGPSPRDAEALAVAAFAFLAAEPERLGRFLAETGLSPDTVRAASRETGFLPAVLDYLLANESVLVAFAAEQNIDPAAVVAACAALPGREHE